MEPIRDHAIIGDCRAAALVSRRGVIDWLCWPRFDSPSVFGALLDERAGHWSVQPAGGFDASHRYIDGTNVVETRFVTSGGVASLIDLMPVASEEEKSRFLVAEHEVLRIVRCDRGEIDIETVMRPRPGYGLERPRLVDAGQLGVRVESDQGLMVLRGELPLEIGDDNEIVGRAKLRAGDEIHLSLTLASDGPAVLSPLGDWSRAALERTIGWWRRWLSPLRYEGPYRAHVERSALVLKLLVFAPSGAVIAAPTTSLPERVGGDLNWDYRYCWLRDAAFTVCALYGLGFADEATAFVDWLLHSTRLTQPELDVLYDVHGKPPIAERALDLSGYRGSRPVRIGNQAVDQLQLDVYGEVIEAVAYFVREGGRLDRETERMLCAFGDYVCHRWQEPDEGIWEPRSGRRHNTHSRVLCWVALDRLLALSERGYLSKAPGERFAKNRELIRREVRERAWNPRLESYAAQLGGEDLDASLLLLSWYGFEDASSPRMRQTYARVRERLGAGQGLLYRYRLPESPGEGAFGICSFWGAEYLALGGGSVEEARAIFETLCGLANPVGLFAEEIDPATGDPVGNFPQAFTHVGLINAALSLARRLASRKPRESAAAMRPAS